MFVDIDNPKSPLGVEVMLFPYKKGKEKLTPEVCLNVLKATNYRRGIRDMLDLILKLPVEEQVSFKDVVLSTFDNREQPSEVVILGKKLAKSGGYEKELVEDRRVHVGEWFASKAQVEKWTVYNNDDMDSLSGFAWFLAHNVSLSNFDLGNVQGLKFQDGAEVRLDDAKNLPYTLNVSMCSKVNMSGCDLSQIKELKFRDGAEVHLYGAKNFPSDLDVSKCAMINFDVCDLAPIKELKFREGAEVHLNSVINLPEKLDLSMCDKVDLSHCDLSSVKELKLCDDGEVHLWGVSNLPSDLDVSMCVHIDLGQCDLSAVNELKFRDEAKVNFTQAEHLPADLDLSMCSQVNLESCDLSSINEIKFRDGAIVGLYRAKLPSVLDVSKCSWVNLEYCKLDGVKKITFKNKRQMESSYIEVPEDWKGKMVFVEKDYNTSGFNKIWGNWGNFLPSGFGRGR